MLDLTSLSHKLHWTMKVEVFREMSLCWPVVSRLKASEICKNTSTKPRASVLSVSKKIKKSKGMKSTFCFLNIYMFPEVCCDFCGTVLHWLKLNTESLCRFGHLFQLGNSSLA